MNSKAVALVIVVGLIALIATLVAVGSNFSMNNYTLGTYNLNAAQALYLSEAGIQRAMYLIKDPAFAGNYTSEDWVFPNDPAVPATHSLYANYGPSGQIGIDIYPCPCTAAGANPNPTPCDAAICVAPAGGVSVFQVIAEKTFGTATKRVEAYIEKNATGVKLLKWEQKN